MNYDLNIISCPSKTFINIPTITHPQLINYLIQTKLIMRINVLLSNVNYNYIVWRIRKLRCRTSRLVCKIYWWAQPKISIDNHL